MSEKFTPGPWGYEYLEAFHWIFWADNDGDPFVVGYLDDTGRPAEDEANAALIAAAPDMYEALEELQRVYVSGNFDTEFQPALNKARAALAKARGEIQ